MFYFTTQVNKIVYKILKKLESTSSTVWNDTTIKWFIVLLNVIVWKRSKSIYLYIYLLILG